MKFTRFAIGWAGMLASLHSAGSAWAQGPPAFQSVSAMTSTAVKKTTIPVDLDGIAPGFRDSVAKIIQRPTVVAQAPAEEFTQGIYDWLLEHPDRASLAWRRLGIPCAQISETTPGRFGWSDGQGTEVTWRTVSLSREQRVWYAEGHARLGPMLPSVPIKAVVVLNHPRRVGLDGQRIVSQETNVYLQTDSKAAATIARIVGPSVPRLAEQGASQLLLFFSGLTRYFDRHPEDIDTLLAAEKSRK